MKIYKSDTLERTEYSSLPKSKKKLIISKKQNRLPQDNFNKRFEELVRICQSISTKPLIISNQQKPITKKCLQSIDLACNDETIQTVLKSRQKGVKSSRSFRLDLPEIKQKQLQEEDSFTKDRNLCLTQRITKKKASEYRNTEMSTNLKTKSVKSAKSQKSKSTKRTKDKNEDNLNKSITPFDFPLQKNLTQKLKLNLDVRKLLMSKNIMTRQGGSKDKNKYDDKILPRKICSSLGSYNSYHGLS